MSASISVQKSKPSGVKRLTFLPRIGLTVDFAGRHISYRQAPILETLANAWGRGFSLKNVAEIAIQQLTEIQLAHFGVIDQDVNPAPKKRRRRQSKASAKI